MSAPLPPRYYGTVFHVTYHKSESKTKDGKKAHLITGKDSIIILSHDWSNSYAQIRVADIVSIEEKGSDIQIKYRNDNKYLWAYLESEKHLKLMSAISPNAAGKTLGSAMYGTFTTVVPTFKFDQQSLTQDLFTSVGQFVSKFYSNFECSKVATFPMTDIIICLYRFRFDNTRAEAAEANCNDMITDFRRQFFIEWLTAIIRACRFQVEPNAFEYYVRIIVNCTSDINSLSADLESNLGELLYGVAVMSETGDATKIVPPAEEILKSLNDTTEVSFKEQPTDYPQLVTLMMKIGLLIFCGNMVQIYPVDIDRLTNRAIEFTTAVIQDQSPADRYHTLRKTVDSFANELLRLMDSRRYDPAFRYVFVAFTISESIRKMKIDFVQ